MLMKDILIPNVKEPLIDCVGVVSSWVERLKNLLGGDENEPEEPGSVPNGHC